MKIFYLKPEKGNDRGWYSLCTTNYAMNQREYVYNAERLDY
jgi:hypothetical protein